MKFATAAWAAILALTSALVPTTSGAQSAKPLVPVKLQMPWTMLGAFDAFTLAAQRGYYREAGLDVTINEGNGSLVSSQSVATGSADIGVADVSTAVLLISKGAKIKSIGVFQPKSALMIAHHPPLTINSITDLKGVTVLRGANDNASQMFSALLAKNKMTWNDVKSAIIAPGAFEPAFLNDRSAVLLGNFYSTYQSIRLKKPDVRAALYADFGINVMGLGMLASERTLAERPDMVRAFLAATAKGFADAVKDPDAGVKSALAMFPVAVKEASNRAQLEAGLALLTTPETKDNGLFWTSTQQWEQMNALLREHANLSSDLPTQAYFTNDYLPGK